MKCQACNEKERKYKVLMKNKISKVCYYLCDKCFFENKEILKKSSTEWEEKEKSNSIFFSK